MGKTRTQHIVSLALGGFVLLLGFQNCSEQRFGSMTQQSGIRFGNNDNDAHGVITQTGGPNCRLVLQTTTLPLRLIFTADVSGSNAGFSGTDPNKAVRGDSIQRFFNSYRNKSNFNWSMVTFSGTTATTLLSLGLQSSMANAINTFFNIPDSGNTPYVAALNRTSEIISGDINRPADARYIVVFFSDGMPNPNVSQDVLKQEVQEIVNLVPGRVSFNTVYYGPYNPTAANRLRNMAQDGGGNFLDTNANPTGNAFLISDLVIVPGATCQ